MLEHNQGADNDKIGDQILPGVEIFEIFTPIGTLEWS